MTKIELPIQKELLELVYPVYLNVPMLTSFIAALEDGATLEAEKSTSNKNSVEKGKLLEGSFGIKSAFSGLLGLDMKGQLTQKGTLGEEETVKVLRKHTEASLFIRFRQTLIENGLIHSVDYLEPTQIKNIQKGSLIEIRGILTENFMNIALNTIDSFKKISEMINNQPSKAVVQKGKQVTQSTSSRNQPDIFKSEEYKILESIKKDISSSKIQDLLFKSAVLIDGKLVNVIVPIQQELIGDNNFESSRYSEITLFGKVISKSVAGGDKINLLRRASIGIIPEEITMSLYDSANSMMKQLNPSTGNLPSPFVDELWFEVLPIALFV